VPIASRSPRASGEDPRVGSDSKRHGRCRTRWRGSGQGDRYSGDASRSTFYGSCGIPSPTTPV
jgi:hypothetical protein